MGAMSRQRIVQDAQHGPALQAEGLDRGQQPLDEAATLGTGTAEGVLPPQHGAAQQALRVVVSRPGGAAAADPPGQQSLADARDSSSQGWSSYSLLAASRKLSH